MQPTKKLVATSATWGNIRRQSLAIPSLLLLLGQSYVVAAQPEGAERRAPKSEAEVWAAVRVSGPEKSLALDLGGGVMMEFVLIPAGSFLMGSADGLEDERPAHTVTISRSFYLGRCEVTQQQWEAVMGSNPAAFPGPQNPVESVGWSDCRAFLRKLNEKFAASGAKFDLPSEAQWEYACRAGGQGKFSFGDEENQLEDHAWFRGNAASHTHPAGAKKPNAWGLYDMHGNVCEWCSDWYANDYYRQSPAADPAGASSSYHHTIRGGCFDDTASNCRVSYRNMNDPSDRNHNVGLRVMCVR